MSLEQALTENTAAIKSLIAVMSGNLPSARAPQATTKPKAVKAEPKVEEVKAEPVKAEAKTEVKTLDYVTDCQAKALEFIQKHGRDAFVNDILKTKFNVGIAKEIPAERLQEFLDALKSFKPSVEQAAA